MFTRPEGSYIVPDETIDGVLRDEANPLRQIVRLIPDGSSVLDIGAGNGMLARVAARSGKKFEIDGVEPSRAAAEIAASYYRCFHVDYVQELPDIDFSSYDFIVLADVLEHMIDPLEFLTFLRTRIRPGSRILVSVPNVAFGAVRIALFSGDWDYVDSGLLERTHLRFFTLKTLQELAQKSDFFIEQLFLLQRDVSSTEIPVNKYKINPRCFSGDELAATYQFLLCLTDKDVEPRKSILKAATPRRGLRSLFRATMKRVLS